MVAQSRALYTLAALALLAAVGGGAFLAYRGDDSAGAQGQVIRWVNVTVEVPEDSGLVVTQGFWGPEGAPPAMFIRSKERGDSVLVIDAETGAVIEDRVEQADRAAVDGVFQTLAVSPLDRSTAPWPYNGEPPSGKPERLGNITYIRPDPAAGISISLQFNQVPAGSASSSLHVSNGRSALGINVATGQVYWDTAFVAPKDKEAVDRFLASVQYVRP